MNIQHIQSIINDVMGSKYSKKSDAQLVGYETNSNPSQELRTKLSKTVSRAKLAQYPDGFIDKIRQEFYLSDTPSDIKTLTQKYGLTNSTVIGILKNQRYPDDVWIYPDFDTRLGEIRNMQRHKVWAQPTKRKLTDENIQEIRDKFYTSEPRPTVKALALQYGINKCAVSRLLQNKTYKIPVWNYPNYTDFILQTKK